MADLKFSKVKLSLDGKQVELSLDQIRKKAEQTATAMKGMKPDSAEWKQARKNLEALHAAEEDMIPTLERVNHYMKEMAHTATTDLGKATRELTKLRDAMPGDHKDLAKINGFIEKFKDWMKQNREMGMTLEKAKAQLSDLVNTPTAKLEQGLAAINKELATNAELSESDRSGLKGMARQYEAQLAVNQYGKAGSAPMQTMTDDQLRAEQSRLRSLYMSTQGATGYEGISKDALDRLQKANQLIKDRAEAEREAARAAKEADEEAQRRIEFAQQGQRTHQTLANMEKASYEDLEAALKHLQEQYKTYASGDVKHIQRNLAAQDQLKQRMKDMQSVLLSEQELLDRVQNKRKYNITELQQAYDQLKSILASIPVGEKQAIESVQRNMKSLQKEISKAKGELTGFAKLWNTALKNIGAYMGVFAAFGYARNLIKGMVTESLNLSDAFAQVQKVTGFSAEEVKKLNDNLSKLDTRTSLAQLNELAFTAGKMGLGKYQLEGVQGFVKAANELQVALGEDLGSSVEEAILPLAKLGENLGLFEKLGVEKAMKSIGSSINELSQTTTAAGRNIVDFARRIQPSAQMVGLTADQILALGSAADSFGLHAEVAATSFTKFLVNYRTNTEAIEQALGITKGTLDEMFARGDTMQGLMLIFQRMHDLGDLRVLAPIFKELGSEGSRMSETFGSFAVNIDQLREHLATSTKAFDEATSVTREYNLVQETAQGIMERSTNIWKNAFVNPDGVDMVKQLADEWYRLSRELTESTTWMTAAKNSLGLILEAVKLLIEALPTLIRLMMFYGVGNVLQNLILNFNNIYRAVILAGNGVQRFNLLLKTNAIAIGVTLLGYVVTKFIDMASASDKATESVEENTAAMERSQRATQTYTSTMASNYATLMEKYDQLKRQWKALKTEHEKNEWIKKNKSAFEELGLSVTNAASAEDVFEKNTARVVEGFKRRAEAAALAAQMTEYYRQKMDIENEAQQMINEKGKEAGDKVYKQPAVMQRDKNANTFNNGQFILGRDGNYYYTSQGAEQYNRELLKDKQSEYDSIDKKIDDAAKRMEDLGKTPATTNVTPKGGDKGDKGGSELKNKFKTAKEQAEGLIAKIDQWYNLQDATINDFAATGKITDDEAKKALEAMKIARNIALEKARTAVASGDDTEWKKFYTDQMSKMMIDHGEWSGMLFEEITKVDIKTLHDFLATFDGSEGMKRLDASSFFDAMRKKAAESKKVVSETQAKAAEELNKLLLKYDYFQQASLQFAKNLTQIGALGTTAEQMAKGMGNVPDAKQTQEAAQSMLAAVIRQGSSIYAVNPSDAKGVADMLRQATTDAMTEADYLAGKTGGEQAKWFDLFPEVKDWMDNPEQHKKELEQLFNVMLIAEQDYYSKRKQSYQTAKREQENRFRAAGFTDQEEQEQTALSNLAKQKDAGINATFMEQQGLGSIASDPEVMAIQNRIYWRNEEVKAAEARLQALKDQQDQEIANAQAAGATLAELDRIRSEQAAERMGLEDLLKEKQSALFDQELNLSTKVAQQLQKRVQAINTLIKPVTDFTQAAGRKIGDMIFNMESEEATWEQLWKNMALAVGESVIQMGAQYAQNLLMQQAMNKASEAEAVADAGVKVTAGIAAGSAKTIGELGWWGIPLIAVISSLLMGLLQSALSTKSSKDGSSSSSSSTATTKTKLVSGMLTYDKGNVDKFAGRRKLYDDGETQVYGQRRYLGEDGKVYTATAEPAPKDGLVTHPIATTVQGQPALVAENGPEIVIGRETTKAIMMNEPELIRYLANYQQHGGSQGYSTARGLAAYDSGNVGDDGRNLDISTYQDNDNAAAERQALINRLDRSDALMEQVLYFLQNPVAPEIAMYDTGGKKGLRSKMKEADRFMARYGG